MTTYFIKLHTCVTRGIKTSIFGMTHNVKGNIKISSNIKFKDGYHLSSLLQFMQICPRNIFCKWRSKLNTVAIFIVIRQICQYCLYSSILNPSYVDVLLKTHLWNLGKTSSESTHCTDRGQMLKAHQPSLVPLMIR